MDIILHPFNLTRNQSWLRRDLSEDDHGMNVDKVTSVIHF